MLRPRLLALALAVVPSSHARARGRADDLLSHALLSRLSLQEQAGGVEFRVLFEPPERPDPDRAARLEALFTSWLPALAERCRVDVVEPCKLAARDDAPRPALVILSRSATFENARRYASPRPESGARVATWSEPAAVVTWWDQPLERLARHELRWPVLAGAAALWLSRYDHRASERRGEQRWLLEGLAGYVAAHGDGALPRDLAAHELCAPALARIAETLSDPTRLSAALLPLALLVGTDAPDARAAVAAERASQAGFELGPAGGDAYFGEQAALWAHFLLHAEDERCRAGFLSYATQLLGGLEVGAPKLRQALGVIELDELDARFAAHVRALAAEHAARPAADPSLPHAALLPAARTDRQRAVAALTEVVSGALERSLAELDRALAEGADPEGLVAHERARLAALLEARDGFAQGLPGAGVRLRLTLDGKPAGVEVVRIEDGELVFKKARAGVERIAIGAIPFGDLARSMAPLGAAPQTVATFLALAGDARWAEGLTEECAAGLRGFLELMGEARARAALRQLASTPTPADAAGLEARVAAVGALVAEHGTSETLRGVLSPLRLHAIDLLEASFRAGDGLSRALAGKVEDLGGRARARQLQLRRPRPARGLGARRRLPAGFDGEPAPDRRRGRGGERRDPGREPRAPGRRGAAARAADGGAAEGGLRADLRARAAGLRAELHGPGRGVRRRRGELRRGLGPVRPRRDRPALARAIQLARTEGPRGVKAAKVYSLELAHGGSEATLSVAGQIAQRVAVSGRDEGRLLLWAHADTPLAVPSLTVEGHLSENALEKLRTVWVEKRLGEMGL